METFLQRLGERPSIKNAHDGSRGPHVCGGCPLVVEGYVSRSPTFCLCSRGWVKAVFGEALGEEVDVDLVQAIGRGDECCEFDVALHRSGGPDARMAHGS